MQQPPVSPTLGLQEYERVHPLLDERRFDEALVRLRVILEGEIGEHTRARAHRLAAWVLVEGLSRPCPEAILHARMAVALFTRMKETRERASALATYLVTLMRMAEWQDAEECARELLRILDQDPQLLPFGNIVTRTNLAGILHATGRNQEALAALDAAEALCADADAAFLCHDVWRRRSLYLIDQGRFDEAAFWLNQFEDSEVRDLGGNLTTRTLFRVARARLQVTMGEGEQAREFITNTLALAREHLDYPAMAECCCLLALVEQAAGEPAAWRKARKAVNYAIASGRRDVFDDVWARLQPLLRPEEGI